MESDQIKARHLKLLTDMAKHMGSEGDDEHDNFVFHMKNFVHKGNLSRCKTMLQKFELLSSRGHLSPGNYIDLKKIAKDSNNIEILAMIEKAEKDIEKLREQKSRSSHKLHRAMAEGPTHEFVPTDQDLLDISHNIGFGWEYLAAYLNLSHIAVQHIKEENIQSTQHQIFFMLLKWRKVEGCNATLTSLFDKMCIATGVSIDWNRLQKLFGPMVDNDKLHRAMAEGPTHGFVPTVKNLLDISNNIGLGWENLAVSLNVPHKTVEFIKKDYPYSIQRQIFTMLNIWRHIVGYNATLTSLFDKMCNATGVSIDWNRLQELFGPMVHNVLQTRRDHIQQARPLVSMDITQTGHIQAPITSVPQVSLTCDFNELDMKLYQKALQEGEEKENSVRVMVVGCHNQGKTSLIKRLLKLPFNKDEPSTIGIDLSVTNAFITKDNTLEIANPDPNDYGKRLALVINDLENASPDPDNYGKSNALEINGLSASSTDHRVQDNDNIVTNYATDGRNMSSAIDGNTVPDTAPPTRTHLYESANSVLQKNITGHDGKKISFWDFGGQFVYYSTHQLFHSRDAIYLLVFDLSKPLNRIIKDEDTGTSRTMEYYLKFWANSIHSFVGTDDGKPPIILVGTHKSGCPDPDDYFSHVRMIIMGKNSTTLYNHFEDDAYAVENVDESDETVNQIFKFIYNLPDKKFKVPAKWIQMDVALSESDQVKNKKIVPFKTVQEVNSMIECPIEGIEQLKLYLRYRHSQGTIIYFDEATLREYVVLEPQYLIDAFKCLITTKTNRMKPKLRKWWKELYNNAKLYRILLEQIWDNFKENFELLLMLLEKYRFIAKVPSFSKNDCRTTETSEYYIVPCFLKPDDSKQVEAFYNRKEAIKTNVSLVYRFESSTILPTIYQQITAAAIGNGKWHIFEDVGGNFLLFDFVGVYVLHHEEESQIGIIRAIETDIYLTVVTCCEREIDPKCCYDFQKFVDDIIGQVFSKYDGEKFHGEKFHGEKRFKKHIRCTCNYVDQTKENLRELDELKSSGEIFPCEHLNSIDKKNAYKQWFAKEVQNQQEHMEASDSNLQAICTEKDLTFIAGCLGGCVEILASYLKIEDALVARIKEDYHDNITQIRQILTEWQKRNHDSATLSSLFEKIKSVTKDFSVVKFDLPKFQERYGSIR